MNVLNNYLKDNLKKSVFSFLSTFLNCILLLSLLCKPVDLSAQTGSLYSNFRIMFYNVENLFDPWDDTLTIDDEFLPGGERNWTYQRYKDKVNKLYKTIVALGEWDPPSLIAVCEIENKRVLKELLQKTPLKKIDYDIIHFDSPDRRGIDVALLYRKDRFTPLHSGKYPVVFSGDSSYTTRDILYVKGQIDGVPADPLHIFVNHWPSRRNGQMASETRRMMASATLTGIVDSLLLGEEGARIIITGDFNDQPENKSLTKLASARDPYRPDSEAFVNLCGSWSGDIGSYKYKGQWYMFDQIIVSKSLISETSAYRIDKDSFQVFHPSFLLVQDKNYLGLKPFSTFYGFSYQGGFSDHLPVMVDIKFSE
ncbi:MAG: endonuclease [Bacteroidota bacterium]|nr:endonuclease [Bacteroidota bacterium]